MYGTIGEIEANTEPTEDEAIRGVAGMLGNLGQDATASQKKLQALIEKYGVTAGIGLMFGPLADTVYAALARARAKKSATARGRRVATEYAIDIRPTKFQTERA